MDNYAQNYAEIESIEIYTDNPTFTDYKQFYRADENIQNTDWYCKAISQSSVFWVPMTSRDKYGNEYWNLSLVLQTAAGGSGLQCRACDQGER